MPEIKRNFIQGKMNKDLDERLVPNGQYRDASNIEIRTSSGDSTGEGNVGSLQNILGNKSAGSAYNTKGIDSKFTQVIGSVADEKNDTVYFFCCAPEIDGLDLSSTVTSVVKYIDYIVEYNTSSSEIKPIVVDHFGTISSAANMFATSSDSYPSDDGWIFIPVSDSSNLRKGMSLEGFDSNGNITIEGSIINVISSNDLIESTVIELDRPNTANDLTNTVNVRLKTNKVLEFIYDTKISAINIIQDTLCWTDGTNEPKKIHIEKFKAGSNISGVAATDFSTHTTLMCRDVLDSNPNNTFTSILDFEPVYNDDGLIKKEHVTVIKKYPRSPLSLDMSNTESRGDTQTEIIITPTSNTNQGSNGYQFISDDPNSPIQTISPGDFRIIKFNQFENTLFFPNDRLTIQETLFVDNPEESIPATLIASFVCYIDSDGEETSSPTDTIKISMLFTDEDQLFSTITGWNISLKQRSPLFELKLARFSYRYRYDDGEYSAFAPFSELAFLPSAYDYNVEEAHNIGMINNIRKLVLKDFIPVAGHRPIDVSEVDILYKETNTANVYTIKTIKRSLDEEWELFTPQDNALSFDEVQDDFNQGELNITSESIHFAVPSNQILRGFDNVPTSAVAQEVTAGRLVYGNYKQSFNMPKPVSLRQNLISKEVKNLNPEKSIKSLRSYKWGVIFGDDFGRETPVVTSGLTVGGANNFLSLTGELRVDKEFCNMKNFFELKTIYDSSTITGQVPPDHFDYIKYYVKETSNEYYNLVMDRWYFADATDNVDEYSSNVWISFASADRNKVDEETYLILKKKHGSNDPVKENLARYKIISIENNAPDFIKTEQRSLGNRNIIPGDNGTGQTFFATSNANMEQVSPTSIIDSDFLSIHEDEFNNLFGNFTTQEISQVAQGGFQGQNVASSSFQGSNITGVLKARIVGVIVDLSDSDASNVNYTASPALAENSDAGVGGFMDDHKGKKFFTRWNTVNKFNSPVSDQIHFVFKEKWGEDADMRSRFVASGVSIDATVPGLRYKIQFKEEVVVNKPEFDGRFFVKIQQDDILNNQVLLDDDSNTYFAPVGSMSISYIQTSQDNSNQGQQTGGTYTGLAATDSSTDWWFGAFNNIPSNIDQYDGEDFGGPAIDNFTPWENVNDLTEEPTGTNSPYNANNNSADSWEDNNDYQVPNSAGRGFATVAHRQQTKNFWNAYNDTFGTANNSVFFIDGSRNWKLSIGEDDFNFKNSTGLDQGETTITAGHLGRMCLATTAKNADSLVGQGVEFYNWMRTPGNYFSFADCPGDGNSPYVYKITLVEDYGGGRRNFPRVPFIDDNSYGLTPVNASQSNATAVDSTGPQNYKKKLGFRITFRRVNRDSGLVTNNGIEPEVFDPRSNIRHDGSTLLGINLIARVDSGGDKSTFTADGACWETEPKEGTDLDIYYEASKALPLRLRENNIFDYIPLKCPIEVFRQESGGEIKVDIENNGTLSDHKIDKVVMRNVPVYESQDIINYELAPVVRIVSTNSSNEVNGHRNNIVKGDIIKFLHQDGTVTKSKITNYFTKTNILALNQIAITESDDETLADNYPYWAPTDSENIDNTSTLTFGQDITETNVANTAVAGVGGNTYTTTTVVNFLTIGPLDTTSALYTAITSGITSQNLVMYSDVSDLPEVSISSSSETINDSGQANIRIESGDNLQGAIQFMIDQATTVANVDDETIVADAITVKFKNAGEWYSIDPEVWKYSVVLPWFNCYSFGNGVESDRINDDFNSPQIDNGVKVSTTTNKYAEEQVKNGMIYSGIYNPNTDVNDLNQFIMAEKITKEINPSYGSIQALKNRYDALIVFTEDKVLKVLANKDAIFNADGNPQLVATNRVLGTATPYVGNYGISKNPESLASDKYRMYFTDKKRGAVLRLSRDGLTPISDAGMRSWFRENLRPSTNHILGTYDDVSGEYNLTINYTDASVSNYNVSYNEGSKGWVSFKSFIPEAGQSVNGKYITAIHGQAATSGGTDDQTNDLSNRIIWNHYDTTVSRNTFYGSTLSPSTVDVVLNDFSDVIKSFKSMSYEGSQAAIIQNIASEKDNDEFYNLLAVKGWSVSEISTDKDTGVIPEFIEKAGKWFNKINGALYASDNVTDIDNLNDLEVQGLGVPTTVSSVTP